MRVRLVDGPTFEKVEIGESVFWIRVEALSDYREMLRAATSEGQQDDSLLFELRWKFMLGGEDRPPEKPGWDNVEGKGGELFAYDATRAVQFAGSLPRPVAERLAMGSQAFLSEALESQGNS